MDKESSVAEVLRRSQRVFKGVRFDVHALEIPDANGHLARREFMAHPGGVVILPLWDADTIVMIRNQRFAVGKELWELPAGTLEPDEPTEATARRELIEETGYEAAGMELLTQFYMSPGICNEIMTAYVARGLREVGQDLDAGEQIQVELIKWDRALQMVREGIICDSKSIVTLLHYAMLSRK